MSNFIVKAMGILGYYYTPRTVLAVLDKPPRDPWAIVAANPPLMPTSASFADDGDDDDDDLSAMAAELWREEGDEEEGED